MDNLYTRKQIATLIGKTPAYVGMYVKRDQLIEKNRKIDISLPINKVFIAKFTAKEVNDFYRKENESIDLQPDKKESKKEATKEKKPKQEINASNVDYVKKQFEIKKLTVETNLKNLELEKKKARVLPLDFVIDWSGRNMRGVFGETVNFGNSLIEDICNELSADTEVKLKYKKLFKMGFNDVLKNGIKTQEPEAVAFAKEYSLNTKW